jgi:hypothetical protein
MVSMRVGLAVFAALAAASTMARAASVDPDTLLHSLIGKDQTTIERRIGPPDESESNGVQTFLRYRHFDSWRTSSAPDPFGYAQGYSGGRGFRGTASFNCLTTLVLTDGTLRAFERNGIGCR